MSSKIKEKIEKLFRKAESAEKIGSLEEAAIFSSKAQELLVQYNLEMSELDLGETKQEAIGFYVDLKARYGLNKTDGDWLIRLYSTISQFNFCKIVTKGNIGLTIVGEEHNIDMVDYICSNLIPTIKQLRLKAWKEYNGTEKTNTFKRGYYRGAVSGIHAKLREQRDRDSIKYEGLPGLILVSEKLVDEKMRELFPNLGVRRSRNLQGASGLTRGYADGKNIQINKGVSGRSNRLRLN